MKRFLTAITFVCLFFSFLFWIVDVGRRTDLYINEIKNGYTGVVVDKAMQRTTILKIKTDSGEDIKAGILCYELIDSVEVGDRIEKVANENYVLLKKKSGVLKLPYLYISEKIRADKRWPKEWKDKWPESTY